MFYLPVRYYSMDWFKFKGKIIGNPNFSGKTMGKPVKMFPSTNPMTRSAPELQD
jgi:hypothetical protein